MKLAILFVIACAIPALEALKCYDCLNPDGSCKNVGDGENMNIIECADGLETCTTTTGDVNGVTVTVYSCYPKHENGCFEINGSEVCFCSKDVCNSPLNASESKCTGSSVVVTLSALFLLIVHNCY